MEDLGLRSKWEVDWSASEPTWLAELHQEVVELRAEVAQLRRENLELRQQAGYWRSQHEGRGPTIGRPRSKINPEEVRKHAKLGLTQEGIAISVGRGQATISRRFGSNYQLGRSQSIISLRGLMWKHARAGNAAITLRLDDRYFGPVERKPQVDDDSVLEALWDDEHSVPAWVEARESRQRRNNASP